MRRPLLLCSKIQTDFQVSTLLINKNNLVVVLPTYLFFSSFEFYLFSQKISITYNSFFSIFFGQIFLKLRKFILAVFLNTSAHSFCLVVCILQSKALPISVSIKEYFDNYSTRLCTVVIRMSVYNRSSH